jgi:hypothetical protein
LDEVGSEQQVRLRRRNEGRRKKKVASGVEARSWSDDPAGPRAKETYFFEHFSQKKTLLVDATAVWCPEWVVGFCCSCCCFSLSLFLSFIGEW